MGTPFEMHLTTSLADIVDFAVDEARARAACLRNTTCPAMTDEVVEALYVPGVAMVLNAARPVETQLHRPAGCAAASGFASTLFDDAPLLANLLRLPPLHVALPSTCTYETWVAGQACRATFTEAISRTRVHVAVDRCPGRDAQFVSVSVTGAWADFAFRPCASVGAADECGGAAPPDGGAPLTCRTFTSNPNELWDAMARLGVVDDRIDLNAQLATCAANGLSGKDEMARRLRAWLHAAAGLPPPTTAAPVALCMPSGDTWQDVNAWFSRTLPTTISRSLLRDPGQPARTGADPAACLASGCAASSQVGDGACQMECYSAACRWDGGDCGHSPAVWPPRVDTSVPVSQRITPQEAGVPPAGTAGPTNISLNVWAPCNGRGSRSTGSLCVCNRDYPLLPGYSTPGVKCEHLGAPAVPIANDARLSTEYRIVGVESALAPWDGVLADGTNALAADRKSGAAWVRPPVAIDVSADAAPAPPPGWTQLLSLTCSGEAAMRFGSDVLALGVSLPLAKSAAAAAYRWLSEVLTCRAAAAGVTPLTPAQFETRLGVWQMASWFYQLTAMPPRNATGATLAAKWAGAAGGFGTRFLRDFLKFVEPVQPYPPGGGLRRSGWGTSGRIAPPDDADCSFDSASAGGDTARGDRRCRVAYDGLGALLSPPGRPALPVTLYADARQDTCGGAQVGPLPGGLGQATLSIAAGAASFPSLALYGVSPLADLLAAPRPCVGDADCIGVGGGAFRCVDVVRDIINPGGMAAALPYTMQDPLAFAHAGQRADGSTTCADASTFTRTLRRAIRRVGGAAPPASSGGGGGGPATDARFCMPDFNAAVGAARAWATSAYAPCTGGSCLYLPPDPAAGFLTNSSPGVVKGLGPAAGLAPGVLGAPRAGDGLFAPLRPDLRPLPPRALSADFVVAMVPAPGAGGGGRGGVSNALKARLSAALASALGARGFVVGVDGVLVRRVTSPSTTLATSGAVDVVFTVRLSPNAVQPPSPVAALITELTGAGSGSIGANAGAALALLGVVPASSAGGVSITLVDGAASASSTMTPAISLGASWSVTATPSAPPPTLVVSLSFAYSGVNASIATAAAPWAALRLALGCGVTTVGPDAVTLVSVRDWLSGDVVAGSPSRAVTVAQAPGAACPPPVAAAGGGARQLGGTGTVSDGGAHGRGGALPVAAAPLPGTVAATLTVAVAAAPTPGEAAAVTRSTQAAVVAALFSAFSTVGSDASTALGLAVASSAAAAAGVPAGDVGVTIAAAPTITTGAPPDATPTPPPGPPAASSGNDIPPGAVAASFFGGVLACGIVAGALAFMLRRQHLALPVRILAPNGFFATSATKPADGIAAAAGGDTSAARTPSSETQYRDAQPPLTAGSSSRTHNPLQAVPELAHVRARAAGIGVAGSESTMTFAPTTVHRQ